MKEKVTYKVCVPATSANIGCGFDSLGIALDIFNEVLFRENDVLQIETECDNTGIPKDETNLIYSSALRTAEKYGKILPPLYLKQKDNIPLSSGMGSSAACAVAGIMIADTILNLSMTKEDMLKVANEIEGHPDNAAPAIYGGFTVCVQTDDGTVVSQIPYHDDLRLIICHPHFEVSTHEARKVLPKSVSMKEATGNIARTALLLSALNNKEYHLIQESLGDVLHQPYRRKLIPVYDNVESKALSLGAYGVCISGAGPSILVFTDSNKLSDLSRDLKEALGDSDIPIDIFESSVRKTGASVDRA